MPSKSPAQARLMQAVANSPKFAKKVGVPQSTGKDFFAADQAQKGKAMATKKKSPLFGGKETAAEETAERKKFPGKAAYKKAEAQFEGERPGMKCGGKVKKMAEGGLSEGRFDEDTYARARKFLEQNAASDEGEQVAEPMRINKVEGTPLGAVRRAVAKAAPRAATKPSARVEEAPRKMAEYRPDAGPDTFDPYVVNPNSVGSRTAQPMGSDRSIKTPGDIRKAETAAQRARDAEQNAAASAKAAEITKRNPTRSVYGETLSSSIDRFLNPDKKSRDSKDRYTGEPSKTKARFAKGGAVKSARGVGAAVRGWGRGKMV